MLERFPGFGVDQSEIVRFTDISFRFRSPRHIHSSFNMTQLLAIFTAGLVLGHLNGVRSQCESTHCKKYVLNDCLYQHLLSNTCSTPNTFISASCVNEGFRVDKLLLKRVLFLLCKNLYDMSHQLCKLFCWALCCCSDIIWVSIH